MPWRTQDMASGIQIYAKQRALLLAAGNKSGAKERRIYQVLIRKADARFDEYLAATTGRESTKDIST